MPKFVIPPSPIGLHGDVRPRQYVGVVGRRAAWLGTETGQADAFDAVVKKTAEIRDIRTGIHLMKEASGIAESRSSKKIAMKDAEEAISKVSQFHAKDTGELEEDEQFILGLLDLALERTAGDHG